MSQSRPPGAAESAARARPLTPPARVLRATDVRFVRDGVDLVEPFSLALDAGACATLVQPTPFAAALAARLCAAIVRPTFGSIFVGEYETRLQPPQAKRRVGYVDAVGFAGDAHAFACEIAFRAECWNLDRRAARERADELLAALGAVDARYARGVALALLADVSLVVLDRPPAQAIASLRSVVAGASLVIARAVSEAG